jgi:hypothetical protein
MRDVARKSFRLGRDRIMVGDRREGSVLSGGWPPMLPHTRFEPPERLRSQGIELSRSRCVQLLAAIYLGRHLPPTVADERRACVKASERVK